MLFPKYLYGLSKDVHKEAKKIVKKLEKNLGALNIPDSEMFTIYPQKHYIALSRAPWSGEKIYAFWLFEEIIMMTRNSEFVTKCFYEALKFPWATLCLFGGFMSATQLIFSEDKNKLMPFLHTVNKYWIDYLELGNIFMATPMEKKDIWTVFSNLKKVLSLLGVPNERLFNKAIPNNLLELVNEYK